MTITEPAKYSRKTEKRWRSRKKKKRVSNQLIVIIGRCSVMQPASPPVGGVAGAPSAAITTFPLQSPGWPLDPL